MVPNPLNSSNLEQLALKGLRWSCTSTCGLQFDVTTFQECHSVFADQILMRRLSPRLRYKHLDIFRFRFACFNWGWYLSFGIKGIFLRNDVTPGPAVWLGRAIKKKQDSVRCREGVIFHLFGELHPLSRSEPKFAWRWRSKYDHACRVSLLNLGTCIMILQGLNFQCSYWLLHAFYNSATLMCCCSLWL